jgi:YD repeat-containing protein
MPKFVMKFPMVEDQSNCAGRRGTELVFGAEKGVSPAEPDLFLFVRRVRRRIVSGEGLSSIIDPMGRVTTWMRDILGRVTSKVYPDTTQTTYAYEPATSRLRAVTDAKNQTTLHDYFIDNNLRQVTYSNAVVATPSVTFTYETNFIRLATMVDEIGTNVYSYYVCEKGMTAP